MFSLYHCFLNTGRTKENIKDKGCSCILDGRVLLLAKNEGGEGVGEGIRERQ